MAGRPAGAWGDVGVCSFGGSKLLSAGRGGALFTRRADVAQRARLALGRGNNLVAPLSEIQAIVLLPQLEKLPARHEQRRRAVERLNDVPGLSLFTNAVAGSPGYYKVGFRCADRERYRGVLDAGFRALHVGRSRSRYRAAGPLEESRRAGEEVAMLHHPVLLDDAALGNVAEALRKASRGREPPVVGRVDHRGLTPPARPPLSRRHVDHRLARLAAELLARAAGRDAVLLVALRATHRHRAAPPSPGPTSPAPAGRPPRRAPPPGEAAPPTRRAPPPDIRLRRRATSAIRSSMKSRASLSLPVTPITASALGGCTRRRSGS